MKIDVQGNSGCEIQILETNNIPYIVKSSTDTSYLSRLAKQGVKQQQAYANIKFSSFRVPKIYSIDKSSEECRLKMEYIYSKNFISFFELADADQIKKFTTAICRFIIEEVADSGLGAVNYKEGIMSKVYSVTNKAKLNIFVNTNMEYLQLLSDVEKYLEKQGELIGNEMMIPIGKCHGDLTLSNILFNDDEYYLIDFLDSFIETPLQDICKLRQDTKYKWSTLMYNNKYDKIKVDMIYSYIDKFLDASFKQFDWYNKYYKILQIVNILRIVPYAKSRTVSDYLYNILKDFIK